MLGDVRAWMSSGTSFCRHRGSGCRQDVDIWVDITVSTTWGEDVDISGVTLQPACPL